MSIQTVRDTQATLGHEALNWFITPEWQLETSTYHLLASFLYGQAQCLRKNLGKDSAQKSKEGRGSKVRVP